ncbi:hypothetical protein A0O34_07350 [Chryseobacterium glaciei]|uniref:Uncharacterized protein n=1 Tax=Chryseobacterium glaciei TaxID=1685010 RepID=A0A172XU27_9FLAO|nr:hypothetical protein A0O34_07350 [Chryseobacterium glaciei]
MLKGLQWKAAPNEACERQMLPHRSTQHGNILSLLYGFTEIYTMVYTGNKERNRKDFCTDGQLLKCKYVKL